LTSKPLEANFNLLQEKTRYTAQKRTKSINNMHKPKTGPTAKTKPISA